MNKPLSLFIAWRYVRAKKRNRFVSFISLASMLGIALGVTVLITVLSVMNGFDAVIQSKFFALAPQLTLFVPYDKMSQWQSIQKKITPIKQIQAAAPFSSGQGMLILGQQIRGLRFVGITPKAERNISKIGDHILGGKLESLTPGSFNLIVGQSLAMHTGLAVGDKVNVFTPQTSVTLAGIFPRYRQFTISGIFHVSDGFGFGNSVAYMNRQDAMHLFGSEQSQNGLHITLHNVFQAQAVNQQLQKLFPPQYMLSDWTQTFGAFFSALQMEKMILFIILLLIVAVAAFNLVSSLVMVVNDKKSDIAILRTIGASPGLILRSFILQGALIGFIGTALGLLGGVLLASHVTVIANWLQNTFHIQFVRADVFFVNYVPSKIHLHDLVQVCSLAFAFSLAATIYPAWMAFKTEPAEALRYE
jgi:lipoprotein-releasing system permease protein